MTDFDITAALWPALDNEIGEYSWQFMGGEGHAEAWHEAMDCLVDAVLDGDPATPEEARAIGRRKMIADTHAFNELDRAEWERDHAGWELGNTAEDTDNAGG